MNKKKKQRMRKKRRKMLKGRLLTKDTNELIFGEVFQKSGALFVRNGKNIFEVR